eukprot:m.199659 g.199659  ORF g.199659 m.199659 type:complete len:667 (+) comp20803_c0_seq1:35-2035(+)
MFSKQAAVRVLSAIVAYCPLSGTAIDNGLGVTPPRGWRSWNSFHADINDTVMRAQMAAVTDTSRSVNGKPTSLAALGFDWVSMDDGWQKCNCSTGGSIDPSLPTCPNCKAGGCSWHTVDAQGGDPVVNTAKFPNMSALVAHGHALGLNVGSYLNNCICMEGGDPPMGEHCIGAPHYEQDVDFIIRTGFDGVKIDNCGPAHNVTRWAELFNQTGKAIRIESCHTFHPNNHTPSGWPNFPVWDPTSHASDVECPMNLYRTGGDIGPSFGSILGEAYATVQYTDRDDPFSHPGCWAYPDMQEIGNFNGADPLRSDEETTHWGLWCVISAPLILGADLSNTEIMDRIWPTVTNTEALAINDAWAGHPGTLVRSYPATNTSTPLTVDQAPCDGRPSTVGWRLTDDGMLHPPPLSVPVSPAITTSPTTHTTTTDHDAVCLGTSSGPTGQTTQQMVSCPPPTRVFPGSGCGHIFQPCESVDSTGVWSHNETVRGSGGPLVFTPHNKDGKVQCLRAFPPQAVGGFYGGPKAAITAVGACPPPSATKDNNTIFTLTAVGEVRSRNGVCLSARPLYGAQLWSKPLPQGKAAALVINLADEPQDIHLALNDIPGLNCHRVATQVAGNVNATTGCTVRDVWRQQDITGHNGTHVSLSLRSHASAFLVVAQTASSVDDW